MSTFKIHTVESAPEESKSMLEVSKKTYGFIANLHGTLAESPQIYEAYLTLHKLFTESSFNADELTVVWQTINIEHECHYCVPAHTGIANMMKVDPAITEALRNSTAMPTEKLQVLHKTTLEIVRERGHLSEEQKEKFFKVGYTSRQILEIVLGLSQKVISNYTNHLADTPTDSVFEKFAWEKRKCKFLRRNIMKRESTLQEKLAALKSQNLAKLPKDVAEFVLADLKKLIESGIVDKAPKNGEKLKDFNLPNQLGNKISLSSLTEKGPVVVTFYRGGWCPYCNLELNAYQKSLEDIKATGATLVAITPENPDESLTTSERHNLEFEVLTDTNAVYANELGLMFTIKEEIRPFYKKLGIDLEQYYGEGQFDVPLASTFIVDTDGTIAYSFVNADYTFRADPLEVLEELKKLKNR